MTLLELLVKELTKSGGWPEGAHGVVQDKSGRVWFYKNGNPYFTGILWGSDPVSHDFDWVRSFDLWLEMSEDCATAIVTREQYEAAITAQHPVWNGDGLPPVGCDVEFTLDADKYSEQGNIPENGQVVNVVAHKQTTCGNPVAVVYWDDRGAGRAAAFINEAFSPICTEADRKREDFVSLLMGWMHHATRAEIEFIYDKIAAGKIPAVELSK